MSDGDYVKGSTLVQRRREYPLRVHVYDDLAEQIRRGDLKAGDRLESESAIAERFGVSRLTAREALLLLEEDGFIENHRGVGRHVGARVPEVGLDGLRSIQDMLNERVKTTLRRSKPVMETATEFSGEALEVSPGSETILLESELEGSDGKAVCMSLEWLPVRSPFVSDLDAMLDRVARTDGYLRDFVAEEFGPGIRFARYAVSVTTAGQRRGDHLGVAAGAPVMVLSQVIYHEDGPVLAAKHIVRSDVAHFAGVQSVNVD